MIESDKEVRDGINQYFKYTREEILRLPLPPISTEKRQRLIDKGYLIDEKDYEKKKEELYDLSYLVTKEGYKELQRLEDIRRNDWSLWRKIIEAVIGVLAILAFLKSFGILN
ncbi:MAG: hypothetical protein AABX26_00040 [Nanoarchaeota archaeon]